MEHLSTTPSVSVTIGRHTRQYFAFVTTAPDVLDSPATLTLQHGPFLEVIAFAGAPIPHDASLRTLVLRPARPNESPSSRAFRKDGEHARHAAVGTREEVNLPRVAAACSDQIE